MYYEESSVLTDRNVLDQTLVVRLDRELAHVYAPGGHGYIEESLLIYKTEGMPATVRRLLDSYAAFGVVVRYVPVLCPDCGTLYDPQDIECVQCGSPVGRALSTDEVRYQVLKQPMLPAYKPADQPVVPDAFVSYRRTDTARLAADIYYFLRARGKSVFLDTGEIPPGADSERTFVRAASRAPLFIMLVSPHYFESEFCKKEIAHALRARQRPFRINLPPVLDLPSDMAWLDRFNWGSESGSPSGLTPALEKNLDHALRVPTTSLPVDLRKEACQFLMEKLSMNGLAELWNRLSWMSEYDLPGGKQERIRLVLQEAVGGRLTELCSALAP